MDRRKFMKTSTVPLALAVSTATAANSAISAELSHDPVERLTKNLLPKIEHDRRVALNILKPSAKDLEHGLKLHADSVVFDSYGFAPRSAIDGDELAALIEEKASPIEIKDRREDMMMTRCATDPLERREFQEAWRASGVTCIYQNAGEEGQDPLILLKRLARYTFLTDTIPEVVSKVVTPDDVLNAKKENRHSLCFTSNGVPLTQQWVSVPDELRYVRVFYELGIRMMHLTYQRRNMIGDGCGEKSNAGLSDFGRAVIKQMNRIGIVPDCAHSGWQTSLEAAQVSDKPVVASHSVCGGIYAHIRSKPDNVIKAIVDSGGYIGICCIPKYLRGKGDINALLDHIDYAARKFGVDHVVIGTDVAYVSSNYSAENKKLPRQPPRRPEFRSLWPNDDYVTTAEATKSVAWTNWPLFTVGLVQRGYSAEQLRKIIGGNVMRVNRETIQ